MLTARAAGPAVIFTFDDGPSEYTPAILDLLAEYDLEGMFFMTGARILDHPATVVRAHDEGHSLGVHGWSHRRLTTLPDWEVLLELRGTKQLLELGAEVTPWFWRAPFYAHDDRVDAVAATLGLGAHFGATLIPDDWCATDPEALARVILSELQPTSVVSLHDGIPPDGGSERCTLSREVTVEALRLVLAETRVRA